MKILVVSDSHGNYIKLNEIIKTEFPFDYIVHCGDGAGDLLRVELPQGAKRVVVLGNVDRAGGFDIPDFDIVYAGSKKIVVVHGDRCGVKNGYSGIIQFAKEKNTDAVFFGHTHQKYHDEGPPMLFNPGPAINGSYGIVKISNSTFDCSFLKI